MTLKPVAKDYVAPKNYTEYADGDYQAVGIEYTSVDDSGRPILKLQKNGPHVRFNLMMGDGTEKGPNHGLQLAQFPMLARAFGVELEGSPVETDALAVSEYLLKAKQAFDLATNSVTFVVKDKWVKSVKGMGIETGNYNYRIVDVNSRNPAGQKSWFVDNVPWEPKPNKIRLTLEILTGSQGQPTPYAGAKISVKLDYGFKYNADTGEVGWETTDTGKINMAAQRASKIYELTAPSMFEPFNPPDPENLIPYWLEHMGLPSCTLFGKIEAVVSSKGSLFYKIKAEDIEASVLPPGIIVSTPAVSPDVVTPATPTPTTQSPVNPSPVPATDNTIDSGHNVLDDVELDKKARFMLYDLLSNIAGGLAFDDNEIITDHGKVVAAQHLTPLRDANKISGGLLSAASYIKVVTIVGALSVADTLPDNQKNLAKATHEQLELLIIGLDENTKMVEAGDNPWG